MVNIDDDQDLDQDPNSIINEFNISLEVKKHDEGDSKEIKNESDPFNKVKKFENLSYKETKKSKVDVESPCFI